MNTLRGVGPCFLTLFLLSLSHALFQRRIVDPEIKEEIDNFIKNVYLPESKTSALGLAVVQGSTSYTEGYGFANREKGILNGQDTQFQIGSITKSITSAVVVKVLHDMFPDLGEAVLDTPIRKLAPTFNFTLIDRFRSEYVTFRDLLAHRVCTFKDDIQMDAETFNTTDEILYRQRYAEEICGIRTSWQYNNQMYLMAGEVISVIANQSYENLVNGLLISLGMSNTTFIQRTDDIPNINSRAQPYYIVDGVTYPMNTELLKRLITFKPAGGLCSTPNDMVRYLSLHLNKGEGSLEDYYRQQVVPGEAMEWLTKPAIHLDNFSFKTVDDDVVVNAFGYGLGLRLGTYDGWQFNHHTGYYPPYNSLISTFPELNIGIFTTSNEAPVYASQVALHAFIVDTLKGAGNATARAITIINKSKSEFNDKQVKKWQGIKNFVDDKGVNQNEIVGQYGSGASGDIELVEKFNNETGSTGIYMSYGKWAHGWLESVGEDKYRIFWDSDMVQDFYAAGAGNGEILATINNGTLQFLMPVGPEEYFPLVKFQLGLTLDKLPPIPWSPDSCGPESK